MSTFVAVNTYTHSVIYVTDNILRSLQDAVISSAATARVYLMQFEEEGDGGGTIQFVDRLDRILYLAIFEVSDS